MEEITGHVELSLGRLILHWRKKYIGRSILTLYYILIAHSRHASEIICMYER